MDDFSRVTWTHLLACKGNVFSVIKTFLSMDSTHFNTSVQTIRTDSTFELGSSTSHSEYLYSLGIIHQTTCSHTLQQNGVVERKHKHFLETARALLFQSKLPTKYLGECILTSTYLVNRFSSSILSNKSPYEVLHGVPPSYSHIRSFGCLAHATVPIPHRDKFHSRVIPYIFLGYALCKKGYKLLHLHNHSIFYSRDVTFIEHIFPSTSSPSTLFPHDSLHPTILSDHHSIPTTHSNPSFNPPPFIPPLRRSSRPTHPPAHLQDFVCNFVIPSSLPSVSKPFHYHQAVLHTVWRDAMTKEFQALNLNHTWDIVPLPPGKKAIPCKWVYKIKHRSDGTIERYKARLVVRGDT